jgi:hypothetical protein
MNFIAVSLSRHASQQSHLDFVTHSSTFQLGKVICHTYSGYNAGSHFMLLELHVYVVAVVGVLSLTFQAQYVA